MSSISNSHFIDYVNKYHKALSKVNYQDIERLKDILEKQIKRGGEIYVIGNGGSASNADHIVGDYRKTFSLLGYRIKITSLASNFCYTTAAANDVDFSETYSILCNSLIESNDFILFLSGSGNSLNLVKTLRAAKHNQTATGCIVAYSGGALAESCDVSIHVPVHDMEIAEDTQMLIMHYIKQRLLCALQHNSSQFDNLKYNKRINENQVL
jgi:D-sedoheptulose 7-phosphate isomerase